MTDKRIIKKYILLVAIVLSVVITAFNTMDRSFFLAVIMMPAIYAFVRALGKNPREAKGAFWEWVWLLLIVLSFVCSWVMIGCIGSGMGMLIRRETAFSIINILSLIGQGFIIILNAKYHGVFTKKK